MDLKLSGKRALITGASQGIGRAIASRLAEEGCELVLVARTAAALEDVAAEVRSRFQSAAAAIAADLSLQAEVERVAAAAGDIDILVNNAGAIPAGDLQAIDDAALRRAWDLKLFGYVNMSRALYPALKARSGVIVNVIGAAGEWLDPAYIAGSTANAALMAFTRALGKGAPRDGMRVVGVNPGPVGTARMESRMRERAREQLGDEGRWRELTRAFPFGRPAMPEEIAAAVAFLASPWSGYTSGAILTIDGGIR
jgi:NAD(P)-dependent dehydrogenase (short-subunit alcohol dehydrogenase family)